MKVDNNKKKLKKKTENVKLCKEKLSMVFLMKRNK